MILALLSRNFTFPHPEPPSHVNISSVYLAESGLTQLVCTAVGGVPDSHNISLLHLNQLIATRMGSKLQTYIADDLFWEFTCIVESLYTTEWVSLFWHEKGKTQIRVQ